MATPRALDEADIRRRIDELASAVSAMDIERAMAMYAPDIVSFDIGPPLRYVGAAAKRRHWMDAFAAYQRPLEYGIRELTLAVGDEVACGHSVNRVSGTLKNGHRSDVWLRWTVCLRKLDGVWLIAHDHVSVPAELESGRALLDLAP
jgi:ketosteroid isomerase-like protein